MAQISHLADAPVGASAALANRILARVKATLLVTAWDAR
jgi:hypothetical protein